VEHSVSQCWDGENETDEWARGADIEKGTSGTNRGANENECAKGAHERREGNEEGIAGSDVMMSASEEMAKLMGEQNGEQGEREGQAGSKGRGAFIEEGKGMDEFIEGNGLILRIGGGELSAGDKAGAKGQEK